MRQPWCPDSDAAESGRDKKAWSHGLTARLSLANRHVGSGPLKVICVMGTRPEAIKMAPVVRALRARGMEAPVLATAQHLGLLEQMLATFGLEPAWNLNAMALDQTPASLTGILVPGLEGIFRTAQPDAVLAQGDTTTVFCAALAAFYAGIPFGHVEAGLRSGNLAAPFPEEGLRRLTTVLAQWHFAPTERAGAALRREGVNAAQIHVVGNTVIDALLAMAARTDLPVLPIRPLAAHERLVLVTLHRRENFGEPLQAIFSALRTFALRHPEARLLFPVHPNPNVKGPAEASLGAVSNIHLTEPLDYPTLVTALKQAYLVLTDSGGLQEEAPALGKPVLVFRDITERPEAIDAGGARLVGGSGEGFLALTESLWDDPVAYGRMASPRFPFGPEGASARIADLLAGSSGIQSLRNA
jgi:UDP-N-acetylglucosamine 2-epimerase (non-hydrolysing)